MSAHLISPDVPTDLLEQQAREQRRRLHHTVSELRSQVRETVREKLDLKQHAREHVWQAAGAAGLLSLVVGYGIAGTLKHLFR